MQIRPTILVIYGSSGDLTRRKLLPALYALQGSGHLPENFLILGFARREWTTQEFRRITRESINSFSRKTLEGGIWKKFEKKLFYFRGDLDNKEDYTRLRDFLAEIDQKNSLSSNKIFYLATSPSYFPKIFRLMDETELSREGGGSWSRVIIEKPFGSDLKSAKALNKQIAECFREDQVFRIDHYLAKETVQNILAFRFANGIFEPLWNHKYIDHVQITASETLGVEERGTFYEESGALRDIVQNHLLQLVSLVAMERPEDFETESVRNSRLMALKSLKKLSRNEISEYTIRGQYDTGVVGGETVLAYRQEPKVDPASSTETFAALKLFVGTTRWRGVPFYLRAGKRLNEQKVEIALQFKHPDVRLFKEEIEHLPNVLTLRIQPNEGFSIQLMAKEPGHEINMSPVEMNFSYSSFQSEQPEAYEKLLLDILTGVQTLFTRADEVEETWKFIDPIRKYWTKEKPVFPNYPAGSWGPKEARDLLGRLLE